MSAKEHVPIVDARIALLVENGQLARETAELVQGFAFALAHKLADAEDKYGYYTGWKNTDWMDDCRARLQLHVSKGDPRDVAAYCAFLWYHGESTAHKKDTDAKD